jgi:polysaccharide export outer membrane protein
VQVVLENGERPIDGTFSIELDGSIRFGSPYDDVNANPDPALRIEGPPIVAGSTLDEARDAIVRHLRKTLRNPAIRVSLGQIAGLQQISGEHLVGPDGTVNLGIYGSVAVTGLTVEHAKLAIEEHLSEHLLNPRVAVDVFAYNSKVYYVILQGAGLGDRVLRFPVTGNETVLDAITNVEGLTGASSTRMWLARPGRNEANAQQVLPVDYAMITQNGDVLTNYQLLPGDRLFIAEDSLVALDTILGKAIAPAERVLGAILLTTSTVQRLVFFRETAGGGAGGF